MNKILVVLLFVFSIPAFSQSVDPLTGRAIVNIPLGSISAYDLSVGVGLSHHGGAILVNEGASNAGVGWSVSFGGYSISREVRGLPDDYTKVGDSRKGWLYNSNASSIQSFTPAADDNLAVCTDESSDFSFINGKGYVSDTEPDIFYFNAPGISGKFVFGSDGLPKVIPYQDIEITFSSGNFIIKTNTGLEYIFNNVRTSTRSSHQFDNSTAVDYFTSNYYYYQDALTYTAAWNLSSIVSHVTGATVAYTYLEPVVFRSSSYYTKILDSSTDVDTLYSLFDSTSYSLPTRIALKNYSINIRWANHLVDVVTISESETGDSISFDLRYTSVKSSSSGQEGTSKSFLMELRQMKACESMPPYKFRYNGLDTTNYSLPIPWKTGWGEDHFGYYNGQNGNQNVPTVYFYASESDGRRWRVTPIPGGTPTTYAGLTVGSRNADPTYSVRGALEKIEYPSGGVTVYTYEGNKYWDSTTSEELPGPGIRVASVTTSGGEYTYGKTNAPLCLLFIPSRKPTSIKSRTGAIQVGKSCIRRRLPSVTATP